MRRYREYLCAALLGCVPLSCGAQAGSAIDTDKVSLRLGGREVVLSPMVRVRAAALAREIVAACGPNTLQYPGNFGPYATGVESRLIDRLARSRLHVAFGTRLQARSHLGGELPVSEAVIGLEDATFFVGPTFTRHGSSVAEHLQCGYLPSLELACLAELGPHLHARYGEACRRFERGADGRIVMPPPDIAPSCS